MRRRRVQQRTRVLQRTGMALLLLAIGVAVGTAPAGALGLSVLVSQATGLVDDQVVEVSWAPKEQVIFTVCSENGCTGPLSPGDGVSQAPSAGQAEVMLPAAFLSENGLPVDCRIEACELQVNTRNGASPIPLKFDQSAPLLPDPALTVTPVTGLVDGQVVDVSWTPEEQINFTVCSENGCTRPLSPGDGVSQAPPAEQAEATLPAAFLSENGLPVDCRIEACELHAYTRTGASPIPLDFDQSAPLLPDPQLTVTPATGLVDGQIVDVSMPGPWGFASIQQCLASGPCLDPVYEAGEIRISASVPVRSSVKGADCGASECLVRASLQHPRISQIETRIEMASDTQSATDATSTFDGPVSPTDHPPSATDRLVAPLAPRFTG